VVANDNGATYIHLQGIGAGVPQSRARLQKAPVTRWYRSERTCRATLNTKPRSMRPRRWLTATRARRCRSFQPHGGNRVPRAFSSIRHDGRDSQCRSGALGVINVCGQRSVTCEGHFDKHPSAGPPPTDATKVHLGLEHTAQAWPRF
jgi:hypothetical protein